MEALQGVRTEFVESLPPDSPAYDAEWTTPYGSEDRLIFVFSVVLDLEEDFDTREYPAEAAAGATAWLRNRHVGTKVDDWGVVVVTVTGRPDGHPKPPSVSPELTLGEPRALRACGCHGGLGDGFPEQRTSSHEEARMLAHLSLRGTA